MLTELDLIDAELSVMLVDDATIRRLNRQHRSKDRATDVLAFPQDHELGEEGTPGGPKLLGDVVISLDTALRQARSRRRALLREVQFLLAHGLLHLVGYDHDRPTAKRTMTAMTRQLVRRTAAWVE